MEEKTSVGEHLMREHGLIHRLILLEKLSAYNLEENPESVGVLRGAAEIMKSYIHGFHEEYEEHDLYPMFPEGSELHQIGEVMDEQHHVGKSITDEILNLTGEGRSLSEGDIDLMAELVHQFETMYVPHAAIEDTEMWPELHKMKGYAEYMKLGSEMEKQEEEKFGEGHFEQLLERVKELEAELGVDDLDVFTAEEPAELKAA